MIGCDRGACRLTLTALPVGCIVNMVALDTVTLAAGRMIGRTSAFKTGFQEFARWQAEQPKPEQPQGSENELAVASAGTRSQQSSPHVAFQHGAARLRYRRSLRSGRECPDRSGAGCALCLPSLAGRSSIVAQIPDQAVMPPSFPTDLAERSVRGCGPWLSALHRSTSKMEHTMISLEAYCRLVKLLGFAMRIIIPTMLMMAVVNYGITVYLIFNQPVPIGFGSVVGLVGFFVMLCVISLLAAVEWCSSRDFPRETPD